MYNPNFRVILSKRGVLEHSFKRELVVGRKGDILEAKRKNAEGNVDKFLKKKQQNAMTVAYIL